MSTGVITAAVDLTANLFENYMTIKITHTNKVLLHWDSTKLSNYVTDLIVLAESVLVRK